MDIKELQYNYGELKYTCDQLSGMEGCSSEEDPGSLFTPFFSWRVNDDQIHFVFDEDQKDTGNDPFKGLDYLPESVEFTFHRFETIKIYRITVPVTLMKEVVLSSIRFKTDDYDVPELYTCTINLFDGDSLTITGTYAENLPDYWYYENAVKIQKVTQAD